MEKMFCYQCQETVGNTGCRNAGACGKQPETARLMDKLISELKVLAIVRETDTTVGRFICQSLFMTLTNANFDDSRLEAQINKAQELIGGNRGSATAPLGVLSCLDEDLRSLRELLTYGLKGVAAYTWHAAVLDCEDLEIYRFLQTALASLARECTQDELVKLVMECGTFAVRAMKLLDHANTSTYGPPEITDVDIGVGNRPGILVSGHDMKDLAMLLQQSKDSGIDIYTHGEMLPAHAYPYFKKYPHLYGNYGNAWHRQTIEFARFNGPILMTTNCITPVQKEYRDRIFTTGVAGFPGIPHIYEDSIDGHKDFSALIDLAKRCRPPEAIDTGSITIGFAHDQVLSLSDKIISAIKNGAIRRFMVLAGCDGRHKTREYYTTLATKLPQDTIILTAGCAKFRYNKLELGDIGGIPRVLDAGQCNDSYSLAIIALKLKEALQVDDINALPISFDIAWYEQKAVAVLLALLSLGFRNIRLGPTLPGFLSPNIAKLLTEQYGLKGITAPETDMAEMLS